jgi:nucleoprotein TPR
VNSGDLKTAQIELAQARGHVEQYKSISESNEQAFQQLNASYETFQATSANQLREKEVGIPRIFL